MRRKIHCNASFMYVCLTMGYISMKAMNPRMRRLRCFEHSSSGTLLRDLGHLLNVFENTHLKIITKRKQSVRIFEH